MNGRADGTLVVAPTYDDIDDVQKAPKKKAKDDEAKAPEAPSETDPAADK